MSSPKQALSHIRVLDLSRVLAGPWCTQNLADLGAEVIKVEKPGVGDDARAWGPPWLKDGNGDDTADSGYYAAANRGKKSITVDIADVLTGMYATVAILAALNHRSVTGRGQYIDMALLDCIVAFGGNQAVNYLISGKVPGRYGNAHANLVPYEAFTCIDGHVIVAVGNDAQWRRYCEAIGRLDLGADPRFASMTGRVMHRDSLLPALRSTMGTRRRGAAAEPGESAAAVRDAARLSAGGAAVRRTH